MPNIIETMSYGLFFANPAQGAAAKIANGGTITLNMTPNLALSTFAGSQYLNLGFPSVPVVPGTFDLGSITGPITPSTGGTLRTPRLISTGTLSTTVHEITYLNGIAQTDRLVDYVWGGAMVFDQGSGTPAVTPFPGVISGKFEAQIVTWTGNGAANRLIPTTFSLASGTVAIWGCGGANGLGADQVNFFRHNGPRMFGTALMGVGTAPITTAGIMSFESGGFRVTDGSFVAPFANTNGIPYVAVVMRDTTSNAHYLRVGTYKNAVGTPFSAIVTLGLSAITLASGGPWTPDLSGLLVTDTINTYRFTYIDATHALLTPAYGSASGTTGFSFTTESPHTVPVSIPLALPFPITHLWVWGSSVAYKSFEFPGLFAVTLAGGASGSAPVNDMLTAIGVDGFTVQNSVLNGTVWGVNVQYDYLALNADASLLSQNFFASFTGVGVGPPTNIAGLPFTPGLIFGRQGGAVFTGAACFRGPAHLGTDSTLCSQVGGGADLPTTGITAIGVGSATFNVVPAPVGQVYYGWAFTGGTTPGGTLILTSLLPVAAIPTPSGLPPNPNPPGPSGPGPLPVPPPTGADNCPPCITLNGALAVLASRLQDVGMVHWTSAELTRYLREAIRTWNALTEDSKGQGTFSSVAAMPFYDLPITLPALRAYTVTDTYMVGDIEYALMEPPVATSWTGTAQFTFQDVVTALQQRRDQYLLETGQVVTRVVQALAGPPVTGRFTLSRSILTLRRVVFIDATGIAYPLQRDDEWSANDFVRKWPAASGVPLTTFPMAYSTGVVPPLTCQVIPPLSTTGTLDMLAVTRAAVMGGLGPCLDPTVGILLGVPDDWTWVVKFGALATLLNQQGVTYDPQRAAYCEGRFRHGVLLASRAHTVLAARINGNPVPLTSIAEADQYRRSWQRVNGTPTQVMLAGQALVALGPVPPDTATTITLDLIRNVPLPVIGTDCTVIEEPTLDPIIGYAMHLALFKEGPSQLQASQDLMDRFFRAAGINNAIDYVSSPNQAILKAQTQSDEAQLKRILTPPPIQLGPGGDTAQ